LLNISFIKIPEVFKMKSSGRERQIKEYGGGGELKYDKFDIL
jgi:hypothetical protein